MAITKVGTDGANSATTNNLQLTYPSGISAGDLIILIACCNDDTTGNSGITTPTGYSLLDSWAPDSIDYDHVRIYAKSASGSESGAFVITITGSAPRSGGYLRAFHGSAGGFSATVGNNFSAFQHDSQPLAGQSAVTTTAITGVPSGAWLMAACTKALVGGTLTCAVTGTHWSELPAGEQQATGAGQTARIDAADNSTDSGTANTCTFTWSASGVLAATSFYVFEKAAAASKPLLGQASL